MSTKLSIFLLVITTSLCFGMEKTNKEEGKKRIKVVWDNIWKENKELTKEDVRNACENNPYVATYKGTQDREDLLKIGLDELENGMYVADYLKNDHAINIKTLQKFICFYEIINYLHDNFYGKDKKEALLRKQKELQQIVNIDDITGCDMWEFSITQELVKKAFEGFTENEYLKDYDFEKDGLSIKCFLEFINPNDATITWRSTQWISNLHAGYDIYKHLDDSYYTQEDKQKALETQKALKKELERRDTLRYKITSRITPINVGLTGLSLFAIYFIQRYFSSMRTKNIKDPKLP